MFQKLFQFADRLVDEQFEALVSWCQSPQSDKFKITKEGGFAVRLTNKTGAAAVKGSVVTASAGTDNAIALQANMYDAIGVVYEDGIADGSEVYVVISGRAQVLLEDSTATTRGDLLLSSAVDGRAVSVGSLGAGLPATDEHFKEIGIGTESVTAGTSKLAWATLRFN